MGLLPSVRSNRFSRNSFLGNVRDVSVSGGGTALANQWSGNYWDGALVWDSDGDGMSDTPYRIDRLSDDLFAKHPELRLFELSPAALALDALARFFPLLEPRPIVVDSQPRPAPLLSHGPKLPPRERERTRPRRTPLAAALWLGLVGVSLWGAWRWPL